MGNKHNVIIGSNVPKIDKPEIFIIEEDLETLEELERVLVSKDYRVRKASKISDAKKSISISIPDLIVLEVQIAKGKGYDFCRYLKDNDRTINVPVIFINHLSETLNRIDGYQAGGIDYIELPLDSELITSQLDTHLKSYYLQSSLLQSYQNVEEHMLRQTANLEHHSEEVKSSEIQYARIFNEMQECYLLVSMDGIVKLINPATVRTLGYEKDEELLGTNIVETVYAFPEQREELKKIIMQEGKVENYEIEFKRKNGQHFIAECHIHPLMKNDEIDALEGLFRDVTLRKQQEMQLLKSEERYALAQRAAHIGSWDWDINKDELTWSETIAGMFGFEKDQFGGTYTAFMERVHPDDCIAVSDAVQASLEQDADYNIEHRIIWPDHTVRWVLETGDVIRNEAGEAVRMLGIVQDITDRKKNEEQRKANLFFWECMEKVESEIHRSEEVRSMLENVIAVVLDIFKSDRAWLLYPCDPEALTFRIPIESTRDGYPGAFEKDLDVPMKPGADIVCAAALKSDGPIAIGADDKLVFREKKEQFNVRSQLVMAIRPRIGQPWMFGLHQCSYEREWLDSEKLLFSEIGRRIGDALSTMLLLRDLQDSKERFSLAVKGSRDGLWDWPDVEKRKQWWSDRIYEMLGYQPGEIEATVDGWLEMVHPDDREQTFAALQEHIEGSRERYDIEYRLKTKTGNYIWIRARGRSIWDEQGKAKRMSGSLQDITDRKESEEKLANINAALDQERKMFISGSVVIFKWRNAEGWPVEYVSPNVLEVMGYTQADLLTGKVPYASIIPEEDITHVADEVAEHSRNKSLRFVHDPYRIKCSDGKTIWIADYTTIIRNENDEITHYLGYIVDITEQIEAQQSVLEKDYIIKSASSAIATSDLEGIMTYANPAFMQMWGYDDVDEVYGKPLWEFWKVKDKIDEIMWALQNKNKWNSEEIARRKDGTVFNVQVSASMVRDEKGNPIRLMSSSVDITQGKEAEERFRLAAEVASDLIYEWDISTNQLLWFGNIDEALGFSPNEIERTIEAWVQLIHPADKEQLADAVEAHRTSTLPIRYEYRVRTKNGDWRHWTDHGTPIVDVNNRPIKWIGVCTDITERKLAEEKLHRQLRLEEIVASISTEFINLESQKIDEEINKSLEKIGTFAEVDRSYLFLVQENGGIDNTHEWCAKGIESQIAGLKSLSLDELPWFGSKLLSFEVIQVPRVVELPEEARLEQKHWQEQDIQSVITVPLVLGNTLIGFLGFDSVRVEKIWLDESITLLQLVAEIMTNALERNWTEIELKKHRDHLEELVRDRTEDLSKTNLELQAAKEKAEVANQAKSVFLANMSHEIRTPMNSILGFTEILKDMLKNSEYTHYLETIYSSGKSLLNIINDILDLSKVEAGKLELDYSAVAPVELFEEMRLLFEPKIQAKGLHLEINIPEDMPQAMLLDESRLRQVLINLIGNAIKFTEKGFIKLAVNYRYPNIKEHSTFDFVFSVIDSGIGIAPQQKEEIFASFTQVHNKKASEFGGTGLGLAITKSLIQLMKGEISVESSLGKGSSFNIIIKDVSVASTESLGAERKKKIDYDSVVFEKATILIADDIALNRTLIKDYFKGFDFTLIEAANGRETIEKAHESNPDLILLDMKMPVMDGYETARKMKNDDDLKKIPIIAVTASAMKNDEAVINEICDFYLKKPVSKSELLRELMKIIPCSKKQENYYDEFKIKPEAIIPSEEEQALAGYYILVVEDNEINQELIVEMLTRAGAQVDVANNGKEALDKIKTTSYVAVLMDVKMPVMDGLSASIKIRELESDKKNIPIIALSAIDRGDDEEACLDAGMNDIVSKPIKPAKLISVLKKWISLG